MAARQNPTNNVLVVLITCRFFSFPKDTMCVDLAGGITDKSTNKAKANIARKKVKTHQCKIEIEVDPVPVPNPNQQVWIFKYRPNKQAWYPHSRNIVRKYSRDGSSANTKPNSFGGVSPLILFVRVFECGVDYCRAFDSFASERTDMSFKKHTDRDSRTVSGERKR